jgi:hypothetical protein
VSANSTRPADLSQFYDSYIKTQKILYSVELKDLNPLKKL